MSCAAVTLMIVIFALEEFGAKQTKACPRHQD